MRKGVRNMKWKLLVLVMLAAASVAAMAGAANAGDWYDRGVSVGSSASNSPDRNAPREVPAGVAHHSFAYHDSYGNMYALEVGNGVDMTIWGIGVRYERFLCSRDHYGPLAVSVAARGCIWEGEDVSASEYTGLMKLRIRLGDSDFPRVFFSLAGGGTYVDQRNWTGSSSGPVVSASLEVFFGI